MDSEQDSATTWIPIFGPPRCMSNCTLFGCTNAILLSTVPGARGGGVGGVNSGQSWQGLQQPPDFRFWLFGYAKRAPRDAATSPPEAASSRGHSKRGTTPRARPSKSGSSRRTKAPRPPKPKLLGPGTREETVEIALHLMW